MAIFVSADAIHNIEPENHSPTDMAGMNTGVAGSAGSPGGVPDTFPVDKPPITNREVEITESVIPIANRSLLDWAGFTFKRDDPHSVAEIIGLESDLFTPSNGGFSGYRKSLRFGNISIYFDGREDMGCHVEMTGQGCRHYEGLYTENPWHNLIQSVLAENGRFTRLDIAIDNVDGALSLDKVWTAIEDHEQFVRTQFREWRRIQKGSFEKGEKITGDTIYLGSAQSSVMFRIYDKAQETGVPGHWIRFEIQLRDKRAHEGAARVGSGVPVGSLASGIINNYFSIINPDDSNKSRCSLQPWWSDWLQSTEKIRLATEQAIKLVPDSMDFIKRQYAPTLAMIRRYVGPVDFKGFMQDVIENGSDRMSAKHEKILAASEATRGGK
jgi:phage replication initiation protein